MSEIICPACQKSNPDTMENCQYCHASLMSVGEYHLTRKGSSVSANDIDSQAGGDIGEEAFAYFNPSWLSDSKLSRQELHVRRWQEEQSEILERILETEGEEKQVPEQPINKSNNLLRIGVAAIMLLSALWPLISQYSVHESSHIYYLNGSAIEFIERNPAGATVLIAVDYDPGFSAEMDVGLGAVLAQMMKKDFYLVLVSTIPTGPIQAERLLSKINKSEGYSYKEVQDFANLGYIPGGSIGLRSFVESPRQVSPFDLNGFRIWEIGPLEHIWSVSDFKMIVVTTENADTAKLWIEQLQGYIENVPVIFVLSTQAEPMIQPYYDENADQIQVNVSKASIITEERSNKNKPSLDSEAQSINLSLFAGGTLILSGVSFYGIIKLLFRREEKNGGDFDSERG